MTTTPGDEIVYRTTPGGELWHPTGTPQDEATAVASDSIHRQLGAQVEEVRALAESGGGLPDGGTPGDLLTRTVDGHAWSTPVKPPAQVSILGPGRPDQPSTTAGTITGSEPVGAEYRSEDGANVGAYRWAKRPGGAWEVTDGDTGWRVFTLAPAPWNGTVSVRVRRIGTTVYMEPHAPSTFGVWRLGSIDATGVGTQVAFTLGDAFRPANRVAAQIVNGADAGDGERLGRVLVDGTSGAVRVKHPANNALAMTAMWPTAQPWPTTLPGTPA